MFDYYYREEAEQFSFIRIPKQLFIDPAFTDLSTDAKLVYGILLDRMSLSRKNGWVDEENRVFIVFPIEEITSVLNYGRDKSIKILKELDDENGVGLIEKKRIGLGKPSIIYVKNFIRNVNISENNEENNLQTLESSRSRKSRLQEVGKTDFKKSEKSTSRSRKNRLQEVGKTDSNNTNYNKTNISKTDYNKTNNISSDDDNEIKDLKQFVACWNNLPEEINKILAYNPSRINNINNLINKYGVEVVCAAVASIAESDFLLGKKTKWKINIDWFCDEDNFAKVLEGYYQDQTKSNKESNPKESKSITELARSRRLKRLAESKKDEANDQLSDLQLFKQI